MPSADEILSLLKSMANPENVAGMQRFGINPHNTLGISIPALRQISRQLGKDPVLAGELWASGIHEARILASLVEDPKQIQEAQMEQWANEFDSWDVCDQVCSNLFDHTPFAHRKACEWSSREEEFVKRAGFVLMACLAVHDKKASDEQFAAYLPIIQREADDERNFVKKAINWALRGIGKRNQALNQKAILAAQTMLQNSSKSARWIAQDALRELNSPAVQKRFFRL